MVAKHGFWYVVSISTMLMTLSLCGPVHAVSPMFQGTRRPSRGRFCQRGGNDLTRWQHSRR